MGIFDKLKTKAVDAGTAFVSMFQDKWTAGVGIGAGDNQYINQYKNWVYACVNARAREIGNINLYVKIKGEKQEEHELIDLLYGANSQMTKSELFFGTQAFLDLTGNAFWFLARDKKGKGKVQEIYLLRPDKVKIILDDQNPLLIKGFVYEQDNRNKIPFDKNEILHFKNFNPHGQYPIPSRGMGVVAAAASAIDMDNESRNWNHSFFKNSARPDGFLIQEGTGTMSDDDYIKLKKQFNQEHGGSSKAHKVAILTGGLKWQEVSKSVKDMDFVEQRRFSRDEILSLFQVPKAVLGIVEDVSLGNAQATDYIFASRCVKPLMQTIVDSINEQIAKEYQVELDFVSPVPEDRAALTDEYAIGIDKWLTRNEVRAKEGLPPLKNGDVIMGTLAQVPIDEVAPQKAKDTKPTKKGGDDLIENFIAKLPEVKAVEKSKNEHIKENKEKIIAQWKADIEVRVGPLKTKVRNYFEEQEKQVLANLKDELKGLSVKEYTLKAAEDLLFDEDEAIEAGVNLITPFIQRYIKEAGGQATELVGGANVFDMDNPLVSKFIEKRAEYFAKTINETTSKELIASIEAGFEDEETADEISQRIADVFGKAKDYRTDMIARTEVSAASNFGASEGYKQAGVTQHQWVVVDPQDDDCLINEGQVVNIGDEFNSGNTESPVHPNCVCTTIPVFED